ncbi:M12 family metallo-peptidase [Glaciecola petra]|uniref:M12 family metallo-peptidase n=1 Tax=Glaciecola petra TaxID=3075602 RepID=A0ABU2ZU56_9ALTE|nr:M12 family metallo-peptidase [Aestuariibacter sp. P117]MDT0595941.1 M12 family metallo-peptidase [Aestuariibacter sp. P117]
MFNILQKYKIALIPMGLTLIFGFSIAAYAQVNNSQLHDGHTHAVINSLQVSDSLELTINRTDSTATLNLQIEGRLLSFELTENVELYENGSVGSQLAVAYSGTLNGSEGTWARFVSFNNKIKGAYYNGENLFIVEQFSRVRQSVSPSAMNNLPSSIVNSHRLDNAVAIFALEDVDHNGTCAAEAHGLTANTGYQALVNELQTSLAGTASKQINIALVADTEFVAQTTNSSGDSEASAAMLNDLNIASGIFENQFDIRISATIVTELESNVLADGVSLESTDPEILVRALRDTDAIPNPGLRHLFTGKDLDGNTVGIAFVGSLCRNSSAGITQLFEPVTSIILAHELGHNFGARHDTNTTECLAPDGGRYIMFPSVSSTVVPEFSACSEPDIQDQIDSQFSTCIVDIAVNPPVISSTPNTEAEVGVAYAYDTDNTVDVDNLGSATFVLEISPPGMLISSEGEITWTPSGNDLGTVTVQIRVENADGSDTQFFEIEVSTDFINIEALGLDSYGRNQDITGGASLGSPLEATLTGNTWKSIPFDYSVTENTIIEFEFSSSVEAEIHGIGFDNDNEISQQTFFNLYGSQGWGRTTFEYTRAGETQLISIPVGEIFTGNFNRLVLTTDNDRNIPDANSTFSNIRVYEKDVPVTPASAIDFSTQIITPFLPGAQDTTGTVEISGDGASLELNGNKWQRIILEGVNVSPTTVLEFEFRSTSVGEVHGIGFLPYNSVQKSRTFQVYGIQRWAIQDFIYTQVGEYQQFVIPVGTYFTQSTDANVVFIMDDDRPEPSGNSSFRNVILRETAVLTATQQD